MNRTYPCKLSLFLGALCLVACQPDPPRLGYGLSDVLTNTWGEEGFDTNGDGEIDVPLVDACPWIVTEEFLFDGRWRFDESIEPFAGLPWNTTFEIHIDGDVDVFVGDENRSYGVFWYCTGPGSVNIDASGFLAAMLGQRIPVQIEPVDDAPGESIEVVEVFVVASNRKDEVASGSIQLVSEVL